MTDLDIVPFFTRSDGTYLCARWSRPIAPVVFGVDDATLGIVKGAIEAVVALADHKMTETDPELGANLVMFFIREWDELTATPDLFLAMKKASSRNWFLRLPVCHAGVCQNCHRTGRL